MFGADRRRRSSSAHRTWHIGPTTCVSTSRRRACCEIDGLVALGEPARASRVDARRRSSARAATASSGGVADEAGGARDPVGEHVRSEAARLGGGPRAAVAATRRARPRCARAERRPRPCARPVSASAPTGSRSSYSPSSSSQRTDDRDRNDAAPVSISCASRTGRGRARSPRRRRRRRAQRLRARDRLGVVLPRPLRSTLHTRLRTHNAPDMATDQVIEPGARASARRSRASSASTSSRSAQEWQVRDLPWGELPPIPEGKGSPQRQARRRDMWRSVLTQQLQADMLAVRDGVAAPRTSRPTTRRSSTTRRWCRTSRATPRRGSS